MRHRKIAEAEAMIQREPCVCCAKQPDTTRRRPSGTSVDLRFLFLIQVLLATRVPAQAARISDSAHVITVSNPSIRSAGLVYRLADRPSIDFGGEHADSMYELSPRAIFDAYRLPGGEIAVLNGYQVRIFDSAGRYLRSLGRAGAGPDEFQSVISELCPSRSDSIVVIEGTRPRFTVFAGANAFVRTAAYQPGHITYHGCLRDGSMIVQTAVVAGSGAPSAQYVLMGTDGRVIRTLGIWPARDVTTILPIESSLIGHGDRIYVGAGKSFEYRVYNAYGVLERIVRTNDAPDRFTDADADLVVANAIPYGASPSLAHQIRDGYGALRHPRTWPAYSRMIVDAAGRTWLADPSRKRGVLAAWTVFDATGKLLGRVNPAASAIARTHDHVQVVRWTPTEAVVMYQDHDGFSHVALVPLLPAR